MSHIITSNNITFMDTSDERKLEVFISSNLPTSQIYNSNTGAYSPDWTVNNLVLEASIFLNSIEKTTNATIQWSKKFGMGDVIATGSGDKITISTNELSDISGIVTYICTAQYDGITATSQMVFTRVDTGINGINGKDGVDGINGTSQYFHVKYSNDGISFTEPNGETSGDWMGTCVTSTADAPTNFDDYEWCKIVGEAGLPGKDGISGKDGTDGKDGVTYYTWIKYADTPTSGMSDDPDGKIYMGLAYNKTTKEESENYSDYIWSRIRGEDGSDGINGVDGEDGKTYYTWVKYADDINGSNMSDDPTGKEYIGLAYNKTTLVESNNASDYQWALFKGADGVDGKDGINGTNGKDGKTTYFHIKYSNVSNPTNNQMTEIPSKYIGTYVDYTETDSSDSSKYTWMKFMGDDGIDGKDGVDGIPGTNGEDGQTYYLHIKYSNDGGKTFTENSGETSGQYIGIYTDTIQNDSTKVSDYTWSLIKGKDGIDGITYYTWIKYADTPTTGMSDDPNGKTYIGIAYNKVEKTESSNYNDYTWSLIKGIDGLDGKTYYTWVKYADDENGANISDDPTGKEYIGLAYNKDTPVESNIASDYIWSLFKGSDGVDGKGILSIEEYYAISTSNSIAPDNDKFSTPVPTLTSTNKYLWNYEKITYTDGTNYISEKRVIGVYGDSATSYSMLVSTYAIVKNASNKYTPSSIKLEGKAQTGNNPLINYSCRFKIEETTDMSSWTLMYASSADETTKEYIPSANIKAVKCSMYQAGGTSILLDYQIIPVVSDGSDSYTVILSNESHTFVASESSAINDDVTCEVIAYKGTEQVAATIGTISGCPNGMTISILNNGSTSASFKVSVDVSMTTKSGMLTIPITVDEKSFIKYFSYSLALKGVDGTNGITFQIYGDKGLILTEDTDSTTLKVMAYDGDIPIRNAGFQWSCQENLNTSGSNSGNDGESQDWYDIIGATGLSYTVIKSQIFKSTSFRCAMTYPAVNGKTYYATAIVQDKNDIYDAFIDVKTIKYDNGKCYWVLTARIYGEEEVDELVWKDIIADDLNDGGTIDSDHYYYIDLEASAIKLRKKNGDTWIDANEDEPSHAYTYEFLNVESFINQTGSNKIAVISSDDIKNTVNITCQISNNSDVIARPTITLTDSSDPIISADEPRNPVNGQIWIDNRVPSNILIKIYDESRNSWGVVGERNVVYVQKPTSYKIGDFWITETNNVCRCVDENGNFISDENNNYIYYPQSTMLAAINNNTSFDDQDWIPIVDWRETNNILKKYLDSVAIGENGEGIIIQAFDQNGNPSPFSSHFGSTDLTFMYNDTTEVMKLTSDEDGDGIPGGKITTQKIDLTSQLNLGNLKIINEGNDGFSFVI